MSFGPGSLFDDQQLGSLQLPNEKAHSEEGSAREEKREERERSVGNCDTSKHRKKNPLKRINIHSTAKYRKKLEKRRVQKEGRARGGREGKFSRAGQERRRCEIQLK